MSTSSQIGELQVCTYITISSLYVPLLFEFILIFMNIIMDITRTSKKRPKND